MPRTVAGQRTIYDGRRLNLQIPPPGIERVPYPHCTMKTCQIETREAAFLHIVLDSCPNGYSLEFPARDRKWHTCERSVLEAQSFSVYTCPIKSAHHWVIAHGTYDSSSPPPRCPHRERNAARAGLGGLVFSRRLSAHGAHAQITLPLDSLQVDEKASLSFFCRPVLLSDRAPFSVPFLSLSPLRVLSAAAPRTALRLDHSLHIHSLVLRAGR